MNQLSIHDVVKISIEKVEHSVGSETGWRNIIIETEGGQRISVTTFGEIKNLKVRTTIENEI